jgi:hypothetical protein
MKKTVFILICLVLPALLAAVDYTIEQARRIDDFLLRIAKKPNTGVFLKKVSFSQDELNAYLNLIYRKKYVPEMTWINLELQDENRVSGSLKAKLEGKKYSAVPTFLRDIEVAFSGKIESTNYHMRFLFQKLSVNSMQFSPEALDEAFIAAQGGLKTKKSMFDWFTMLPGLKNISLAPAKVIFYY